jgi:L-rhamnose mutarotase
MEYKEKTSYTTFKRFCKTLELQNDPEIIAAYKKAHEQGMAWPEITQGIREVGILDMEIYLAGNQLFMIMDTVPDFDHGKAMKELADKPLQAEWEAHMARFQNTSANATADEKWRLIERIFKLE